MECMTIGGRVLVSVIKWEFCVSSPFVFGVNRVTMNFKVIKLGLYHKVWVLGYKLSFFFLLPYSPFWIACFWNKHYFEDSTYIVLIFCPKNWYEGARCCKNYPSAQEMANIIPKPKAIAIA